MEKEAEYLHYKDMIVNCFAQNHIYTVFHKQNIMISYR